MSGGGFSNIPIQVRTFAEPVEERSIEDLEIDEKVTFIGYFIGEDKKEYGLFQDKENGEFFVLLF